MQAPNLPEHVCHTFLQQAGALCAAAAAKPPPTPTPSGAAAAKPAPKPAPPQEVAKPLDTIVSEMKRKGITVATDLSARPGMHSICALLVLAPAPWHPTWAMYCLCLCTVYLSATPTQLRFLCHAAPMQESNFVALPRKLLCITTFVLFLCRGMCHYFSLSFWRGDVAVCTQLSLIHI